MEKAKIAMIWRPGDWISMLERIKTILQHASSSPKAHSQNRDTVLLSENIVPRPLSQPSRHAQACHRRLANITQAELLQLSFGLEVLSCSVMVEFSVPASGRLAIQTSGGSRILLYFS